MEENNVELLKFILDNNKLSYDMLKNNEEHCVLNITNNIGLKLGQISLSDDKIKFNVFDVYQNDINQLEGGNCIIK